MIGGPVCQRDWILPKWFDHVKDATWCAGEHDSSLSVEYVFAVASWDRDTQEVIRGCKPTAEIIEIKEPQRTDQRVWNENRYAHMVSLRNTVLGRVRELEPDYFWSLDSDVLPQASALNLTLTRGFPLFDAVGMRTWMTPSDTQYPSYAMLRGNPLSDAVEDHLIRLDHDAGVQNVHVIMASKVMAPAAYAVDYQIHKQGEDVGWSKQCLRAGLQLGWCAEALCKHVMAPELLDKIDPRLGW